MSKVEKVQELQIETEDKAGVLAEITSKIANQSVNILALCAYGMEGKAFFMMLTSDNEKAKSGLSGYNIKEKEVVLVSLKNEVGAVSKMSQKLKEANINLEYIYGTTCECTESGCECRLVLSSNDNDKVVEVLGS